MTRPGTRARTRTRSCPAAALVLVVLGCAVVLSLRSAPAPVQAASAVLAALLLAAAAGATALWRAQRSAGARRTAWAWASIGCWGWAAGQAVRCADVLQERPAPSPSPADAGSLVLVVGLSVALVLLTAPAAASSRRLPRRLLDGLTVAVALAMVSWVTVLQTVVAASAPDPVALALALARPVSDLVLLVLAVLLLTAGVRERWSTGLLAGGVVAYCLSDSAFALMTAAGGPLTPVADVGFAVAFALLAAAPLHGPGRAVDVDTGTRPRRLTALPYLAVVLAVVVVVGRQQVDGGLTRTEEVLARATVALVLLLQFVTLRENDRLVDELATREQQLHHLAFHDALTGLANRALFSDRLAHAVELHRSDLRPLAVIMCDLDDFKRVNDSLGHAAGDELLRRVSERLRGALRSADTLARLGGDEFAVLLEHGDQAEVTGVRVVEALSAPFTLAGGPVVVRASVGVAVVEAGAATPDAGALLSRADTAMYAAKRSGKQQVRVFEPGMRLAVLPEPRRA